MPTNPNMEAIETVTVGSTSVAFIEFTNIPQDYTDLKIILSGRDNRNDTQNGVNISINGSTSNFSGIEIQANGSALDSFVIPRFVAYNNGANSLANTFANSEIYFSNYTSSNNKAFSADSVQENNQTTAYILSGGHIWSNSAAITSIRLTPDSANFVQHSTATLYGVTSAAVGAKATGGAIYQDADYFYHVFSSSGTFTPTQSITADCLVVAGGGGGGGASVANFYAGGGGAGGVIAFASQSLTAQNYTVTVGGGGSAGAGGTLDGATDGGDGSNSQFGSLTAGVGGGGGASRNRASRSGGSGGGASSYAIGATRAGGTATSGQGFAGGSSSQEYRSGGGGGAGAAGGNGAGGTAGDGGAGTNNVTNWGSLASLVTATNIGVSGYIAGGGQATANNDRVSASGGGGMGATDTLVSTAGATNTGSGGGAGSADTGFTNGAAGGSGIVIVRYAK